MRTRYQHVWAALNNFRNETVEGGRDIFDPLQRKKFDGFQRKEFRIYAQKFVEIGKFRPVGVVRSVVHGKMDIFQDS